MSCVVLLILVLSWIGLPIIGGIQFGVWGVLGAIGIMLVATIIGAIIMEYFFPEKNVFPKRDDFDDGRW